MRNLKNQLAEKDLTSTKINKIEFKMTRPNLNKECSESQIIFIAIPFQKSSQATAIKREMTKKLENHVLIRLTKLMKIVFRIVERTFLVIQVLIYSDK